MLLFLQGVLYGGNVFAKQRQREGVICVAGIFVVLTACLAIPATIGDSPLQCLFP